MAFRRSKFRFFPQLESADCGPACLSMVASHYGINYPVKEIKKLCGITRIGVSVQDIADGAGKLGFEPAALKLTIDQLEEIPLPAILFWKQDHFIVLRKIRKKKTQTEYHLADPGYGQIILNAEMIRREWMGNSNKGVAIVLEPGRTGLTSFNGREENKSFLFEPILAFLKEHKFKYVLTCLLLLFGLLTSWMLPTLFRKIIDDGIIPKSYQVVWILLLAQLGLFFGNFISDFISHWMLTKINFNLSVVLKNNLLHKIIRLPIRYFDTRLNTETLLRMADQDKIQTFITWKGLELLLSILNICVFSVLLFESNRIVFAVFISLSTLSLFWISFFLKLRKTLEYSMFLRHAENNNNMYEFIMHMPEIKINNAQQKIINSITAIQNKLNEIELRSLFLNMYQLIGVGFLSHLKEIIAIAICAYSIINGNMTFGALMSVTYILGQLSGPIQNLISYVKDAQDAGIANSRINEIYSEQDERRSSKNIVPEKINSIDIEGVGFKYPGSFNPFVLSTISFNIPSNKVTAIVGPSGSGKTTLLKLLLSYYPVTRGQIMLDNRNLSQIDPERWRKKCGIVLQDGHIFSGTVADNIALADANPDMEKLQYASRIACIASFIDELPMGYDTKVGNTGIELSGGQKQRLLIARAVYKDPDFIFFDEATSSLDSNNEKAILDNLNHFFKGRTVVIIAHRLSTVKNADQIIVLDKGRLAEQGTHPALAQSKGIYYHLVRNQLELGN